MQMEMQQLFPSDGCWWLDGMELQCPASIICIWWSGTPACAAAALVTVGAKRTAKAINAEKSFRRLIGAPYALIAWGAQPSHREPVPLRGRAGSGNRADHHHDSLPLTAPARRASRPAPAPCA